MLWQRNKLVSFETITKTHAVHLKNFYESALLIHTCSAHHDKKEIFEFAMTGIMLPLCSTGSGMPCHHNQKRPMSSSLCFFSTSSSEKGYTNYALAFFVFVLYNHYPLLLGKKAHVVTDHQTSSVASS